MPDGRSVILLADDSRDDVDQFLRALKRAGLVNPVHVVNNGDGVIEYLSGTGRFANREEYPMPNVLLLDIKMPGRDGLEVLEWITIRPNLRRLLVVVLTGLEDRHVLNRAYELGAHTFLTKPVNGEDLHNLVNFFKGYFSIVRGPSDARMMEADL